MAESKAAAARREKKDAAGTKDAEEKQEPKIVEWQGLKLELPIEPPEEMLFDIAEVEASPDDTMSIFRVLRSLLGRDQFIEVRNKVAELRAVEPDEIHSRDVIEKVLEAFGMSLGESSASQDS